MAKRKVPVHHGGQMKKLRFRDTFPGQMRFPEASPPIGIRTVIVLIVLAITVSALVWWLKS